MWQSLIRTIASATRASDAEDLLQAAYIKLEEYQVTHRVENPSGFLVTAAVNIARDEYRRARIAPMDSAEPLLLSLKDGAPLQDEILGMRQRLNEVRSALAKLSPRSRKILLMHRVDNLKYREISEIMGISVSAVEKHIAKATLFLADRISD
jgi:RNA polymerase sigma factor (sigma-70 family)